MTFHLKPQRLPFAPEEKGYTLVIHLGPMKDSIAKLQIPVSGVNDAVMVYRDYLASQHLSFTKCRSCRNRVNHIVQFRSPECTRCLANC